MLKSNEKVLEENAQLQAKLLARADACANGQCSIRQYRQPIVHQQMEPVQQNYGCSGSSMQTQRSGCSGSAYSRRGRFWFNR